MELYFDNGLNFDAAFPCLLAELENGVKETGKNGGKCKDCQHAAVVLKSCAAGVDASLTRSPHGKSTHARLTVPARNTTQSLAEKPASLLLTQ